MAGVIYSHIIPAPYLASEIDAGANKDKQEEFRWPYLIAVRGQQQGSIQPRLSFVSTSLPSVPHSSQATSRPASSTNKINLAAGLAALLKNYTGSPIKISL